MDMATLMETGTAQDTGAAMTIMAPPNPPAGKAVTCL
jgi:hypothetical protein